MGIYSTIVIETVTIQKIYTVEADSEEEAREKAEIGDTVEERELRQLGVVNRDVESIGISSDDALETPE